MSVLPVALVWSPSTTRLTEVVSAEATSRSVLAHAERMTYMCLLGRKNPLSSPIPA